MNVIFGGRFYFPFDIVRQFRPQNDKRSISMEIGCFLRVKAERLSIAIEKHKHTPYLMQISTIDRQSNN